MATLEDSNGMTYIEDFRQWEITDTYIKNETGVNLDISFGKEGQKSFFLKQMRRVAYNLMESNAYNNSRGKLRAHKNWIKFLLFKNQNGEREALSEAYLDMVRDYDISGGFIQVYEGKRKLALTQFGINLLTDAGLIYKGPWNIGIPEDEFEVGY